MLPHQPLPFRKAAAKEIAFMAQTLKLIEDDISDIRLARDRLASLRPRVPDEELDLAIDYCDSAALALGAIRRRLSAS
ncbi:MAG: hypothetical protein ACHQ0J_15380 [Candidatus Dormibacterales bacterium]